MRTKLLLIFTIFFCGTLQLNAQFNTGRYLIGGGLNMYTAKNVNSPDSKTTSLNTNIQFGKIVKENTVVGVILGYGHLNSFNPGNYSDTNKANNYGVGVFYRKYKKLLTNLNFFGEINAGYSHADNMDHNTIQSSKSISDGASVSFNPGISYTVCKAMQIELLMPNIISLSYSHQKADYDNIAPPVSSSQKGNAFSMNTNFNTNFLSSFGIGFKFLFAE